MKKTLGMLIISVLIISSCKKEDKINPTDTIDPNKSGTIILYFDNRVGSLDLVLDSMYYTNTYGQDYSISKFDYFISNIVLTNENGSTYTVPVDSSYFLVKENIVNSRKLLIKVPEGNYTAVKFVVGIDSLMNTKPSGERPSTLDVGGAAAGMYWTWNSGYIFLKMEGKYDDPTDTISTLKDLTYHIGGFGGFQSPTINNIKNVSINFGDDLAEVREAHGSDGPNVHMYVDASKVISGSTNVNFSTNGFVMFSPYSVNIANNYVNMFSMGHVHNHEH